MIDQMDNERIAMAIAVYLAEHGMWCGCTITAGSTILTDQCPSDIDDYKTTALNDHDNVFSYTDPWLGGSPTPITIQRLDIMIYLLHHSEDFNAFAAAYGVEGAFWESENSDTIYLYIPDDQLLQFETCSLITPQPRDDVVRIRLGDNAPKELQEIMEFWYNQSRENGDGGASVFNAGIECTFEGQHYFIHACSPWQGSLSWETGMDTVMNMLRDIGATDITYICGSMD